MSTDQTNFLNHQINPSFSGHQTFPFRYMWLKKGVDAVREDAHVFASEEATVTLGVGKNMVASIRHWCQTAGLIEPDPASQRGLKVSAFGETILAEGGLDSYLDDAATLWLIHWQIARGKNRATTWFWAFNVFNQLEFTSDSLTNGVMAWAERHKKSTRPLSANTIKRDVNCFIRTYCLSQSLKNVVLEDTFECPLVELNLIVKLPDDNRYQFQRGAKPTLPPGVVAFAIAEFWKDARFSDRKHLSFSELMYSKASPGRVFKLDEDSMTRYLEMLSVPEEAFQYEETTGLKQLFRSRDIDSIRLLQGSYE